MRFTKMHGLGNDYIYLNCLCHQPDEPESLARRLSDRHFGVGADGLICICASDQGDFRMRMFNADGSEGEMCGNGIRCLGKYVYDKGLTRKQTLQIETGAGLRQIELIEEHGRITGATVDMGIPKLGETMKISIGDRVYTAAPVSMGNPHAVVETDDLNGLDMQSIGPILEHWPGFPDGANIEFVKVSEAHKLQMRVWERGSGETLACGTGACAALAAMAASGKCSREAQMSLRGGKLYIRWDMESGHIFMTGPAVSVFDGELAD